MNVKDGDQQEMTRELSLLRSRVAGLEASQAELNRVQEKLKESEDCFRTIADFTYDWEEWVGPDGKPIYISPSCERITGYPPEAFHADPKLILDITHHDDRPLLAAHLEDERRCQGPLSIDFRITARTGQKRWIAHRCQPVIDHHGHCRGTRSSNREITDQKGIEEELRKTQEKFAKAFQASPDSILLTRLSDGKIIEVNDSFLRTMGYDRSEMIDTTRSERNTWAEPKDRDIFVKTLQKTGECHDFETVFCAKDGKRMHGLISGRTIEIDGEPCILSMIRDISDRKRTEEALQESEAFLNATGRMAKVGGWELNAETLEVRWTEETYRIHEVPFGYKPPLEEAINFFHPEDREKLSAAIRRALEHGEPYDLEIRFITANGNQLWTRTVCKPEIIDGRTVKLSGTFQDITERKRMEDAIRESAEKIKLFAYTVCHDLKSPSIALYGITMRLQKLFGHVLEDQGKHYCEQILKASEQIASLVESINQYIVTKESPLMIETVKLQEILEVIRDEFSTQFTLRQITWAKPRTLSKFKADRLSLMRVLRNLVENALKYGGDELSEIRVDYEESEDHHVISVTNDGAGIRDEDAERIFLPFNRAKGVLEVRGAGLGLAIVKEIAEHHGGMAWFQPVREKGCAFYVSISKKL